MSTENNKKYTFHVNGMHCSACVFLTENELIEHPNVIFAKSYLATRTVEIHGDFGSKTHDDIAKELSQTLSQHSLSIEKRQDSIKWNEFFTAIPIAFALVLIFFLLQKFGIVNIVNSSSLNYGTAFVIGIIASLSTCMAVVGGVLLSMSATFAKTCNNFRPQALFHISRILSFFILGGIIGILGSTFQLGTLGTFVIGIVIGIVMILLGINLLDIFDWSKRFQPSMPKIFANKAHELSKVSNSLTPILIGTATFFLPCGFTQSMQIYTLSTGNFLQGGLTMLSFALGTFPVLALISFSSFSIHDSSKAGVFFKTAGIIVILFAIFNIINSLVSIGLINPVFNF